MEEILERALSLIFVLTFLLLFSPFDYSTLFFTRESFLLSSFISFLTTMEIFGCISFAPYSAGSIINFTQQSGGVLSEECGGVGSYVTGFWTVTDHAFLLILTYISFSPSLLVFLPSFVPSFLRSYSFVIDP